jgi:TolA-binding protein
MPDTLSSIMGSAQEAQPKKLKRIGNAYTDDQGNWYPVEAYDAGDMTPYPSKEAAEKAGKAPEPVKATPKETKTPQVPTSAMQQPPAPPGPKAPISAMEGAPEPEAQYQQAVKAYEAGSFQEAMEIMQGLVVTPEGQKNKQWQAFLMQIQAKMGGPNGPE